MDVTVREISEQARRAILDLSLQPNFGTLTSVYEELSSVSGLSVSWIAKFYQQAKDNPTQDTLDNLIAAINAVNQKAAA